MNFYQRFISLCNNVGKTPSRVAVEIGLAKPTVNRWKNGSNPTDATAMKIAEYFGVPVKELTGEENIGDILYESARDRGLVESPFKETPTDTDEAQISECKQKLIKAILALPESQAELLLMLAEQQKKNYRE